MNVRELSLQELTEEHIEFLCKFCTSTRFGTEPKHVIARAMEGKKQLWEADLDGVEALFVTEIEAHPAGHEFRIYGVAGIGVLAHFGEFMETARELARKYNCKFIGVDSENPTLRQFYEKHGLLPVATRHLMEL